MIQNEEELEEVPVSLTVYEHELSKLQNTQKQELVEILNKKIQELSSAVEE